jgi:hypothetical protein
MGLSSSAFRFQSGHVVQWRNWNGFQVHLTAFIKPLFFLAETINVTTMHWTSQGSNVACYCITTTEVFAFYPTPYCDSLLYFPEIGQASWDKNCSIDSHLWSLLTFMCFWTQPNMPSNKQILYSNLFYYRSCFDEDIYKNSWTWCSCNGCLSVFGNFLIQSLVRRQSIWFHVFLSNSKQIHGKIIGKTSFTSS